MVLPLSEQDIQAWFASRQWQAHDFQMTVWSAMAQGRSGLLHASTGSGKTYAVWMGALLRAHPSDHPVRLQVLWITPMRALAADTVSALSQPLGDLIPSWRVESRTGDTSAAQRVQQQRRGVHALVTTPESLSVMLTREQSRADLGAVHTVIVDEWHELLGSKRGVQTQLALARLRRWNPNLVIWGLSATLGNLAEAAYQLTGSQDAALVQARVDKRIDIDTLLPAQPGRFSWSGHLGSQMLQPVIQEIEACHPCIIFTNVRSQAEIWYQLILQERPDWAGVIALHHGSLDKSVRQWVERGLKEGSLKAVVATSSLDLGVDFLPVERVLQIGSAKAVARMLQRAGRSGHAPGRISRATLVPTHTLELVEAAAVRLAAAAGKVESRHAPAKPMDVLVQHLVTVALGGGFDPASLFEEVRSAPCYADLTLEEFEWAVAFCEQGGDSLHAYPHYHRIRWVDGCYRVPDRSIAMRHRLQVGTIVSDTSVSVRWVSGGTLGHIEEGFIARLKPGDVFVFAGRMLEFVRTRDMSAWVRKATRLQGVVPAWAGSKMGLSGELAREVMSLLHAAGRGEFVGPEMGCARPMLEAQVRLSQLPRPGEILVETYRSREGQHLFIYPFAGRRVHLGLAQLIAWKLARQVPNTFSLSVNDYGLEIVGARDFEWQVLQRLPLGTFDDLRQEVLDSLNSAELSQRRFRDIARVAGLVFSGYPGAPHSSRQLQASSGLFFEVFQKYDPHNRLLLQAREEVLSQELDLQRLFHTWHSVLTTPWQEVTLKVPSPFALPLMVERFRERLSNEKLQDRLERLLQQAEKALDATTLSPAAPSRRRTRRSISP